MPPFIHIADEVIVFGTLIRWLQDDFLQDNPGGFRHLHIEIIVADKAEKDAVAVDAIVSHHLFHGNLTSARTLVDDVLYKVRTASHMSYIFLIGCRITVFQFSGATFLASDR